MQKPWMIEKSKTQHKHYIQFLILTSYFCFRWFTLPFLWHRSIISKVPNHINSLIVNI
ncbi:hypothetical protein BDZ91DRAFT_739405 [Kalaharituber pfeilii]|nr:hypothetical protein BDZ91DRAFT_739405 [Kalaharituber pfeilii]